MYSAGCAPYCCKAVDAPAAFLQALALLLAFTTIIWSQPACLGLLQSLRQQFYSLQLSPQAVAPGASSGL